jgi:hypothetical protein
VSRPPPPCYTQEDADKLRASLATLDAVVAAVRANPLAPYIRVFGSAAAKPGEIPGDIDVFLDRVAANEDGVDAEALKQASADLIAVARRHYGWLDAFMLGRAKKTVQRDGGMVSEWVPTLFVRNDEATGWIEAKKARELLAAARAGTPIAEFGRVFVDEFAAALEPSGTETVVGTLRGMRRDGHDLLLAVETEAGEEDVVVDDFGLRLSAERRLAPGDAVAVTWGLRGGRRDKLVGVAAAPEPSAGMRP